MTMRGISMSKTEYDLKAIIYPVYGRWLRIKMFSNDTHLKFIDWSIHDDMGIQ